MKRLIKFILIFTILNSCETKEEFIEKRIENAEKFIECLKKNNREEISKYIYKYSSSEKYDESFNKFYIDKAHKFIDKFGLPEKNDWDIIVEPENNITTSLTITIPIFKGYDSILNIKQIDLVLKYPPKRFSDKIDRFKVNDVYDSSRMKPIEIPDGMN